MGRDRELCTKAAIRRISHWRKFVRENDDRFLLLTTANDAERAKAEGKLALAFHFQGTTPFGRDLGMVEMFYGSARIRVGKC